MPDIYVPYNSEDYPEYYNKLLDRGLIFRYAFKYTDTHREALNKYEDFKDFDNNFRIGNTMFNDFLAYTEEMGVARDAEGIKQSEKRIKTLMKAFIGRNLFDDDGFYPIYHRIDETFLRALEHLEESSKPQ